ncbi:MAG: murein biosynthesis integral membrane protein MurJ [Gemmatimonadales bacterium]|nr:MAG: murein biosynthesis integral membrane protein MurJ [Gemmatimonadales bacterium]
MCSACTRRGSSCSDSSPSDPRAGSPVEPRTDADGVAAEVNPSAGEVPRSDAPGDREPLAPELGAPEPGAPPSTPTHPGAPRASRSASLVSAGILLSRIAGLARERALGHYFGASVYADAWRAALRLPNVIQNLLGEGTLSASFIPVYARMIEEDRQEAARRFAGAVFGLLLVTAGALVLLGMALAPLLVGLLFPRFDADQHARTTALVRILFPMTGILVLSAWSLGILNTHRRFFLPYVAPVAWNAAILAALVGGGWYLGWEGDALLRLTAGGALLGGFLQFAIQLPGALRLVGGLRVTVLPWVANRIEGVREAVRAFLPVLAGRGVVNVGGLLDYALAGLLATGALAVLGYAQVLYMLPISLFGMAVAASELPELARSQVAARRKEAEEVAEKEAGKEAGKLAGKQAGKQAGQGTPGDLDLAPARVDGRAADLSPAAQAALAGSVRQGMLRVAYFLVPSVAVYLFLGDVVVAALYQTGAFGPLEVRLTWAILAAYALGMGASATSRLLSSAFYALGNTATPARVAVLRVTLALAVGAALMFPLDRFEVGGGLRYGAVGLALGSALGAWVELGLLRRRLARDIGPHGSGVGPLLRLVTGAGAAVAVGWGLRLALAGVVPGLHPIPVAAVTLGAAGAAYLGVTSLLGVRSPLLEALGRRGGSA